MKVLIMTSRERVEKFTVLPEGMECVWAGYEKSSEKLIAMAPDADAILVDAISPVVKEVIEGLPNLKLIHSEGVGYEGIDLKTASERGIYVCNNKGCNAKAVAEQSILLMLSVLKRAVKGDFMTRNGEQIKAKTSWIMEGIPELGGQKVGIIGLGDIGKETARLCNAFNCEVVYYNRHRLSEDIENALNVTYTPVDELMKQSDIVSLHMASNEETFHFMNQERFKLMKHSAFLINTARGELVDNDALAYALENGIIAGAGIDTVAPEPVLSDNRLLNMSDEASEKITFSPHIGGVTQQTFVRIYKNIWSNMQKVNEGKEPACIVNPM